MTTTLLLHAVWLVVIRRLYAQNSTRKVTINSTFAIILRCSRYNMNARLLIYGKSAEFGGIDKMCCLKLEEIGGHALRQPLPVTELRRDSYYNLVREYILNLWLVEPGRMATYSLIVVQYVYFVITRNFSSCKQLCKHHWSKHAWSAEKWNSTKYIIIT